MSSNFDNERIPDPIAEDLQPAFSQERVDRLWRDIAARRDGEESVRRAPRGLRSPVIALAAAACVMIGGFTLIRALNHADEHGREQVAQGAPLTRRDGSSLDAIKPTATTARVPLSDGSELWVDKGAVLAPLDVSERSVVLHLLRGRARFAVKPGGPRRWVVEAGVASVEVVGTRFTVDRDGSAVRVNVEEGKVLVRGVGLPDGVVRLSAGEQVLVPGKPQAVAVASDELAAEPILPAQRIELEAAPEPVQPAEPAQPRAAPAPLPAKTVVPAATAPTMPDADVLFAIADEARIARDYQRALEALQRVVREYSVDPRAKLAAFTIGRIRDEQFRDLAAAAESYEKALALGLSGSLAEDCYARLMRVRESQVREGRVPRSRLQETAEQYVRRYPKGRYAAEARRLLDAKVAP